MQDGLLSASPHFELVRKGMEKLKVVLTDFAEGSPKQELQTQVVEVQDVDWKQVPPLTQGFNAPLHRSTAVDRRK